jgi:predicted nicotinamide N-methyase
VHPEDPRTIWEDVPVGAWTLRVRRPPSAEDLIDEAEFADDERLPYWAEVWPSGRVLCGVLAEMDLAGRSVIELGGRNLGLAMDAEVVDWREPPDAVLARAPYDLVVGADILYEARNGVALGRLIPALSGPATQVIIADPRRPDARPFVDAMQRAGWGYVRDDLPVPGRIDETGPIVHVHRFTPPPGKHNEPVVI